MTRPCIHCCFSHCVRHCVCVCVCALGPCVCQDVSSFVSSYGKCPALGSCVYIFVFVTHNIGALSWVWQQYDNK